MKDYCSYFPEEVQNQEIGQTCCKQHDNDVGEAGTYNPVTPHIKFYKCLRSRNVTCTWATIITIGGTIGSWIKYPYFVYTIYKYRKEE